MKCWVQKPSDGCMDLNNWVSWVKGKYMLMLTLTLCKSSEFVMKHFQVSNQPSLLLRLFFLLSVVEEIWSDNRRTNVCFTRLHVCMQCIFTWCLFTSSESNDELDDNTDKKVLINEEQQQNILVNFFLKHVLADSIINIVF